MKPVSAPELSKLLTLTEPLRLIDARWYLKKSPAGLSGEEEYRRGHIPGAIFWDLDRDLSRKDGPGRHPFPSQEQFHQLLERSGITPATLVVVYDDAGGSVAARVWYMLRSAGHERVTLLDGGLQAWEGALSSEVPQVEPTRYPKLLPWAPLQKADVVREKSRPEVRLLDARAAERYRGEIEPIDARAGHIPGALNVPWSTNVDAQMRFLPEEELRKKYASLTKTDNIAYCGSGVTACHVIYAMHLAGIETKLYEGSWSDWAKDETLPMETGSGGAKV